MKSINLLTSDNCHQRALARRRRTWAQILIIAAATGAMSVAVCRSIAPATVGLISRKAYLEQQSQQLLETAATQADALKERQHRITLLTCVARQPDLSMLLAMLGQWCVDGIRLESVSVRASQIDPVFEVRIVGLCTSQDLATVFVESARVSKVFDEISLVGTRRVDRPDSSIYRFELRCTLSGLREQVEALR
ncbi:MAG: hypothetical protein Kow0022_04360 [Phycisphaerales bacterium]